MDKGVGSSLFVNDGSFMEKFKQLQKEKETTQAGAADESKSGNSSIVLRPNAAISKIVSDSKTRDARKSNSSTSNGKLAFSLKQKSKLAVAPVKLGADEDEDEVDIGKGLSDGPAKRQKLGYTDASEPSLEKGDVGNSFLYKSLFIVLYLGSLSETLICLLFFPPYNLRCVMNWFMQLLYTFLVVLLNLICYIVIIGFGLLENIYIYILVLLFFFLCRYIYFFLSWFLCISI